MVKLSIAFVGLVAASASAAPILHKRIAQVIADSTAKWEKACLAANGGQKCNPLSITAFTTLLAAAGDCEQQDAADNMIDLAKQLNNDAAMISLTQIFVQQPRNSPNSVAVPYCQTAPRNQELNGLFQCQFVGSNQNTFANGAALGGAGTIPFGQTKPLNPLGSCPANPQGPIPDGQQLVTITTNPNAPGGSSNQGGAAAPPAATSTAVATEATTVVAAPPAATTAATTAAGSAGGFALSNGQAAQKLNAQFATLTASSPCTDGENACVGASFAQCVGGKFVTTSCGAAPLTCAALPLVNSPGTSITCTTTADAETRIAATGATGGLTGSGSAGAATSSGSSGSGSTNQDKATTTPKASAPSTGSSGSDFHLDNGKKAQALNAQFAKLTASSSCTEGENACVAGGFAQCVSGKFVITKCAATLTCAALPLVNSPGTSIACTTEADALSRIQATGATGGLTGA